MNDINQFIFEQFDLTPTVEFTPYYFEKVNREIDLILEDAQAKPVNKKGLIGRIWGVIQKSLRNFSNQLQHVTNAAGAKGGDPARDAENAGVKPNENKDNDANQGQPQPEPSGTNPETGQEEKIDVNEISTCVTAKFDNGQWTLSMKEFNMKEVLDTRAANKQSTEGAGMGANDVGWRQGYVTLKFLTDNTWTSRLTNIVAGLKTFDEKVTEALNKPAQSNQGENNQPTADQAVTAAGESVAGIIDQIQMRVEQWEKTENKKESFILDKQSIKTITTLQTQITDAMSKINLADQKKVDLIDKNPVNGKPMTVYFNQLASLLTTFQYGLNYISGAFSNMYIIDEKYSATINTPEQMAAFVKNMIESGIPARYVAYNIYRTSTNTFRGKTYLDQLRMTLTPSDNNPGIYKFALNPMGRRANMVENSLTDQFHQRLGDATRPIAYINQVYENGYGVMQEKTNRTGATDTEVQAVTNNLKQALTNMGSNNVNLPTISTSMVGRLNTGNWVLTDYNNISFGAATQTPPTNDQGQTGTPPAGNNGGTPNQPPTQPTPPAQ